jgi:ABC-type transport system substrate-binding protein
LLDRLVRHTPGVEVVLEAYARYWRKSPPKARQLLAEAGYPTGFDAGEFVPMPPFLALGEAIVNHLKAVGIQVTMRPWEGS